jgi:adenine C2-methylase RlmN of 23S rRNA A2503 and tRNA A37
MVKRRVVRPWPAWDEPAVLDAFAGIGVKALHAESLWVYLTAHPHARTWDDVRWAELRDFPPRARELLIAEFAIWTSRVEAAEAASDGSTTKLVIRLQDGHAIEAVQIHHAGRCTLCISSQIGCAMGCSFCATGTMGILGDLLAGEIVEQLQHARARAPVRNVVFMGMGEPLNNYHAVLAAVRAMLEPRLFGLAPRHVTVSTVGIVPRIRQFARECDAGIALSLHAPTQAQREAIMPAARAFPLPALMDALAEYAASNRKQVMIEYIMLRDANDADADAHALGALLAGRNVMVNLIPYNPTDATPQYARSADERTAAFKEILREGYALKTFVRRTMGTEVASACGQLVKGVQRGAECGGAAVGGGAEGGALGVRDIEDAWAGTVAKRGGVVRSTRRAAPSAAAATAAVPIAPAAARPADATGAAAAAAPRRAPTWAAAAVLGAGAALGVAMAAAVVARAARGQSADAWSWWPPLAAESGR